MLREPVPSDAESFVRERLRNRDHSFVETLSRAVFSWLYLTHDEWKGATPIVRGGREIRMR